MKIFVFDTETTGFGATDEVIQLAGFLLNEKFECEKYLNFYCNPSSIVPPDAVAVHGLTNKFLSEVSGGKVFEDYVYENLDIFGSKNILFVSYNLDFDARLVNQTLYMNGIREVDFGQKFTSLPNTLNNRNGNMCLMKTLTHKLGYSRWQKLEYVVNNHSNMPKDKLKGMYNLLLRKFGDTGVAPKLYHNASFDSFVCWILLKEHFSR